MNNKFFKKPPFPIWEIIVLIMMWIDKKKKAEDENGNPEEDEVL